VTDRGYHIDGVVVLYNPPVTVFQNISSYRPCLNTLYIIDNTEQPLKAITDQLQSLDNCIYISNKQNLGISAALNTAAEKAVDASATWLLTMDQDSFFSDGDCLRLINYALEQDVNEVGIVSPLQSSYLEEYRHETLSEEPFTVITSGNLVSLDAYRKVGGFNGVLPPPPPAKVQNQTLKHYRASPQPGQCHHP